MQSDLNASEISSVNASMMVTNAVNASVNTNVNASVNASISATSAVDVSVNAHVYSNVISSVNASVSGNLRSNLSRGPASPADKSSTPGTGSNWTLKGTNGNARKEDKSITAANSDIVTEKSAKLTNISEVGHGVTNCSLEGSTSPGWSEVEGCGPYLSVSGSSIVHPSRDGTGPAGGSQSLRPKLGNTTHKSLALSIKSTVEIKSLPPNLTSRLDTTVEKSLDHSVGPRLGQSVEPRLGQSVGPRLGQSLEPRLGQSVGPSLGYSVGPRLGQSVGPRLGQSVGSRLGHSVGKMVAQLTGTGEEHSPSDLTEEEAEGKMMAQLTGTGEENSSSGATEEEDEGKKMAHLTRNGEENSSSGGTEEEAERIRPREGAMLRTLFYRNKRFLVAETMEADHWRRGGSVEGAGIGARTGVGEGVRANKGSASAGVIAAVRTQYPAILLQPEKESRENLPSLPGEDPASLLPYQRSGLPAEGPATMRSSLQPSTRRSSLLPATMRSSLLPSTRRSSLLPYQRMEAEQGAWHQSGTGGHKAAWRLGLLITCVLLLPNIT